MSDSFAFETMALEIQSPYTRPPVNIVVVGDSRTGKTSLITTFVSSIFPANVPRVLQQVLVPPEETSDGIALVSIHRLCIFAFLLIFFNSRLSQILIQVLTTMRKLSMR